MRVFGPLHALRIAVRRLRRSPGYAMMATVCLAIGLGSVITILAIVNALFLKPLPGIQQPDELVTLHVTGPTSVPNLLDVRAGTDVFVSLGAFTANLATVREADVAERVLAASVTADYFETLRTRPAMGRFFSAEEDGPPDVHPVAVVSHAYWRRRLSDEPGALGRTIRVNGRPVTVVGVAPPGFIGTFTGFPVDVWVPLSLAHVISPGFDPADRAGGGLELIARLGRGVTLESARAALSTVASRLRDDYPEADRALRIDVLAHTGFDEEVRTPVLALVAVLLSIAGLVLLIACLNFTNMLLARSSERSREAAIRRALGVDRHELIASMLTENVLLALMAGGTGILVARWLSAGLTGFLGVLPIRIHLELGLDWRLLGSSVALALIVAVATGLLPALQVSRRDLVSALKGTGAAGHGRSRPMRVLVTGQLAGSVILLVVTGLFLQAVLRATALDLGFATQNLRVVPFLDASLLGMEGPEAARFYQQMVEDAGRVPGVVEAAVASSIPIAFGGLSVTRVEVPGLESPPGESGLVTTMAVVSPEFTRAMGIPLLAGRNLRPEDGPDRMAVALVSEAMAHRLWPQGDAVGRRFRHLGREVQVVGVVGNVSAGLDGTPGATFYLHQLQSPVANMSLLVRLQPGAPEGAAGVRRALQALSPDLPTVEPQPAIDLLLLSLLPQRVAATVGGGLGVAGLLLAALGVYGLVALSVVQRRSEIGIRMAVGAARRDVLTLVFRDTMGMAGWGVGAGILGALGAGRLVARLLLGVSPAHPVPLALGAGVVMTCAVLATVAPARRAVRLDPMAALTPEY